MLNYELARAIQVDRERDVRRAVRERSLRSALAHRHGAVAIDDVAGKRDHAVARLRRLEDFDVATE